MRDICNNTFKFGNCKFGNECKFKQHHEKSLKMHIEYKNSGKCVYCALKQCTRCNTKKQKVPKTVTGKDGWTTVKPSKKEVVIEQTVEEKLFNWLQNIHKGIESPMPIFEGNIKISFEDKTIVFTKNKGFVIRQKTTYTVEEIDTNCKPAPLSLVWKDPSSQIYNPESERKEKEVKEVQELLEKITVLSSPELSDTEHEELEHDRGHYNIGWNQKNPDENVDEVWNSFDN